MSQSSPLPVLASAAQAWRLLWHHRVLHLRAIWPPVLFLVAAEFLYHRIFGNADSASDRLQAVSNHPWWMVVAALACWLAGLKFLLSFSISWRRHLLLQERFDPFFFKTPFWRYLGFLVLTYAWMLLLLTIITVLVVLSRMTIHATSDETMLAILGIAFALTGIAIVWAIIRQAPFFTALTFDAPQPSWRRSVASMRHQVWRYLLAFVLAMMPVVLLNGLLDAALNLVDADRRMVPVALGESAFRQAMLFVHFSLGASIGALLFINRFGAPPDEIATRRD